jgi:hypothetical protein
LPWRISSVSRPVSLSASASLIRNPARQSTTITPGSTGIVVFFEGRWIAEVDKALAHA